MLFIRDYSYTKIKRKFVLLYVLNVIDIVLTLLLLETGMFIEANGIMEGIVTNPVISMLIKVGVVGVLLIIVYKRMIRATKKQLKIASYILNFAIGIYIIINISHLVWVDMYFRWIN